MNQAVDIRVSPSTGGLSVLPVRVKSFGRELMKLDLFRRFHPLARQVATVARTPNKVSIKWDPEVNVACDCGTIKVMSANLWHDWPRYRRLEERLDSFIRLVEAEQIDILLLQEVIRKPGLQVDGYLADQLGMAYVYSRANGHDGIGFEEGIAIFSRFAIRQPHLSQLGRQSNPFIRRMALGVTIETPCGDIMAYSVHLGINRRRNASQVAHLHSWVNANNLGHPTVVGGDFNSHETSMQLREMRLSWQDTFRHIHPMADGHTHVLRWPWGSALRKHRLDYIFLLPDDPRWKVVETRHLTTAGLPHSDHHAVLTRLEPTVSPTCLP